MFTSILLPVDLNHEASWTTALPMAAELARRDGATLHILGVQPDFGMTAVAGYFPADFQEKALRHLSDDLATFAREQPLDGVAVETHVGLGHAAEQIVQAGERVGADLIVMASHQPDMMRSLLVGSVADKVVHAAHASVLVVRA